VQKLRVRFAKRGRLRFTSHRDFQRAFERAVRRAGLPVAFSHGFSPHPKISYAGAAPTGAASEAEYLEISLTSEQDPEQVRAALDREGLRAPSAHVSPTILFVGWDRSLAIAHRLGHEYLIVPSFTADTARSLDDWREWADRFNTAGAAARRAGIWLAFHNEPDHMTPIDGKVPYDVFLERTDPSVVRHQLDVGNMAMGGGDPLVYLQRYRDRYWSFHLKDVVADRSSDTELGTGTLDFRRLLAAVPDIGRKPCYVEQEGAADSVASARRDYEFLSKLEF